MQFSEHRVLVTGAHGWIGRYVCKHLAERGFVVAGIGHGDWTESDWKAWGLSTWLRADVTEAELIRLDHTPNFIIHCAGGSSVKESLVDPSKDYERTVGSTRAVLDYMRGACPDSRMVLVSSAAVYGAVKEVPISEDGFPKPISPYGSHKLFAEEEARRYGKEHSLEGATLRLFSVYGPGLRKQLLWDACQKIRSRKNEFFGTGEEVRDWLFISDATSLIEEVLLSTSTSWPTFNGGTGVGLSNRELLRKLFETFGVNERPNFCGAGRAGDPDRYIADIRKAKALGWEPKIPIDDGIREYVAWFKEVAK